MTNKKFPASACALAPLRLSKEDKLVRLYNTSPVLLLVPLVTMTWRHVAVNSTRCIFAATTFVMISMLLMGQAPALHSFSHF